MRVIHAVASLRAEHGGPSRSVTALAGAQAQADTDVHLLTTRAPDEGPSVACPAGVHLESVDRPSGLHLMLGARDAFSAALNTLLDPGGAVLHDHGIWLPTNRAAARVASRAAAPRVVSVRGMLSEWALAAGAPKKRLAWWAYQRRDLQAAALIHATSDAEAADVRAAGVTSPLCVVPNGVTLPQLAPHHPTNPIRTALFVGRIHPVKGLQHLVEAWGMVRPPGWQLVIAGPDEGGHRRELERLIAQQDVADMVTFTGPVADSDKWNLYRSAELFVLPSLSENFGVAVAEALASGVPVIATRASPWGDLPIHGCGWWVATGTAPLASALRVATAVRREGLRVMGRRGRTLVANHYTWESAAARMISAYQWLLGCGTRPPFVDA